MDDIRILVVEDDLSALESLIEILKIDNFDVVGFSDPLKALEYFKNNEIDLVLSDIKMPHLDGLKLLEKIKNISKETEVILMTAFGDINSAVDAVKKGANHYILKPVNYDELKNQILKISEFRKLRNIVSDSSSIGIQMVAVSPQIKKILEFSKKVAATDSAVLIEGETGTGKELVSKFIHHNSSRSKAIFLPINCAALPKELLEAELFGFEKGSFTGAINSKKGKFLLADGGTIFLDEISEMDYDIQAKLLRVLEDGIVTRIGSDKNFKTDIRIIAATNKNLEQLVQQGNFRKDLFFRLNVFKIKLPSLTQRREDILPLVEMFIKNYSKKYNKNIKSILPSAFEILSNYNFPGNIRELKHIIERAVIVAKGDFIEDNDILLYKLEDTQHTDDFILIPYSLSLKDAENKIIIETLKKHNFDKRKTADILGISVRKIELRFKEIGTSLKELKS